MITFGAPRRVDIREGITCSTLADFINSDLDFLPCHLEDDDEGLCLVSTPLFPFEGFIHDCSLMGISDVTLRFPSHPKDGRRVIMSTIRMDGINLASSTTLPESPPAHPQSHSDLFLLDILWGDGLKRSQPFDFITPQVNIQGMPILDGNIFLAIRMLKKSGSILDYCSTLYASIERRELRRSVSKAVLESKNDRRI